jgi:hypothetical protein
MEARAAARPDAPPDCPLYPRLLTFRLVGYALSARVCFWHFSEIPPAPTNIRYRGKADMTRTLDNVR